MVTKKKTVKAIMEAIIPASEPAVKPVPGIKTDKSGLISPAQPDGNIPPVPAREYERYLTIDDIRTIPPGAYPFMVFCDNIRGLFSLGVKIKTKGSYGHFMWMIAPDTFASQWFYFRLFTVDHFTGDTLKFVHNPNWTDKERDILISAVLIDLKKPWYRTLYDVPGMFGELLGIEAINLRSFDFCSERGKYLNLIDPEYDLRSPTPTQLNTWSKERGDRYKVYGRYTPD
jgi:hypothetical protein